MGPTSKGRGGGIGDEKGRAAEGRGGQGKGGEERVGEGRVAEGRAAFPLFLFYETTTVQQYTENWISNCKILTRLTNTNPNSQFHIPVV